MGKIGTKHEMGLSDLQISLQKYKKCDDQQHPQI
jgi:hypothetical protein